MTSMWILVLPFSVTLAFGILIGVWLMAWLTHRPLDDASQQAIDDFADWRREWSN